MIVLFLPEVQEYYNHLEQILYENGYFSFSDSSKKYVKELIEDIKLNLPTKRHKPAPNYFEKYGRDMQYAVFKKNKHTSWYIFFTVYRKNGEEIYLIRYIATNHTAVQRS